MIAQEINNDIFDLEDIETLVNEDALEEDKIISRWYQNETIKKSVSYIVQGYRRILIILPTGSGKTHTSRMLFKGRSLRKALNIPEGKKLKLLFVTHKHRLAAQAMRVFDNENNIEFITQSAFSKIPDDILKEGWDITCIDEAHHEAMLSFQIMIDKIKDRPLIGLTATPHRGDNMLLKFEKVVSEISRRQAVEQGFLADTYLNSVIDTGSINKTKIITKIISDFSKEMKKTIIFVRTKKEIQDINDFILNLGFRSVALTNQSDKELDQILEDFSNGKYDFIVNCQKISEGVDVVGCDNIILGKNYKSEGELNQSIGRASRPDSDCNVWQLINPLKNNIDSTNIVGEPKTHRLISYKHNKAQIDFF